MFKVECPRCKAPYQVDERRVPPSGLKMRCPKCGTSFQVEPPPADPRGTNPNPVLGAALGGDTGASNEAPGAAKPPLPRKKPAMKGTMIGVAPPLVRPNPPLQVPGVAHAATQPAMSAITAPPEAPDEIDLPAVGGQRKKTQDPFGEIDLPAPAPPLPARGLPRPNPKPGGTRPGMAPTAAPPQAKRPQPIDELDLPSPASLRSGTSPGFRAPDPSNLETDLPMPATSNVGLPSPVPGRRQSLPAAPDLDLPSLSQGVDLPSRSFGADLPSPSHGIDLPSVSTGAGLPSPAAGGIRGFGEIDLPIVSAGLPAVSAGLPAVSAGLPVVSAGLPVVSAGLPEVGAGLPAQAGGLPVPVAPGLPAAAPDDPFALHPSPVPAPLSPLPPAFGVESGHDPFEAPPSDRFGGRGAPDPFGATGAALGTPFSDAPPSGDPFRLPDPDDPDPFGPPNDPFGAPRAPSQPPAPAAFDAGDDAGEFAPPQSEDAGLVRQAGGGTAYGEVNLDDDGPGNAVGIEGDGPTSGGGAGGEFVGLPTESAANKGPAVAARRPLAAPAPGSAVAEIKAKKRRTRVRVVVATIVVTAIAGGSLTLVPELGPFGAYFIVDQLRRGEYERALAEATATSRRDLSSDTYPDAENARAAVFGAASHARRYKPLAGYAAFVGFLRGLRFGQESDVYAQAKVMLEELTDAAGIDEIDLAQATRAAADGQLARARGELTRLSAKAPANVDVAVARGEVELRARDAKSALAVWTTASTLEKSARTAYGLARAQVVAGDLAAAQKLAEDTLAMNPRHVGARLLLAEAKWSGSRDETSATKLVGEALAAPADAGPEERIEAETLLGEISLNRGRVSQAEEAFGEAIKIADRVKAGARAARALSGLGETLFRAGRYSQAIARFKAAAQADPDYVLAQVGVAKASLELERISEAKDMLTKLRKSYPGSMQVGYWYGRVEESLGDRKEAEQAYRDAIAAGKDDPDSVQAFIALASVESQNGEVDAARGTLADAQKRLPESSELYKALGKVAMTQGRYADGLAAFQRALALHADDVEAKFLVGTALTRQHEFDKALEDFDAVAKIDRDFPGLALERGILFQESGRTEEALREYEAALAKAPNDPDLMLKVGCGKADAGDGTEAEKLLRKVFEQRQNSAETHFCLGRALMVRRNLNDALKEFEQAVQIDPNRAEYYLYVGWTANDSGNLAKATTALKKALDLDQGLADAYWQRGILRVRETRAKDAVDDLTKALSLKPSRYEAHADLALAYYDLGKEDLALAEWQKAIAANPNRAEWHFHFGKLLSLHLQAAAAAAELKKAIDLANAANDSPPWLSEAHRLAALSLGNSPAAIPHWQAFLQTGAANSPYREEAKAALKRLGAPWTDE